jgi:1,4-dihydroxy-2-naphthoate octaprenyltransferase
MIALSWFYTAPPFRLNYRGLGEIVVAAVLDLLVPLLAHGLQSGRVSAPAALLSALLPLFVVQVARMMVMNLSDHEGDARVGKRTLAVLLGPRRAGDAIALGQLLAYGSVLALTTARILPAAVGVAMLLTLPVSIWQTRRVRRGALRDAALANSVVFWASTHVALLTAAATFGFLLATPAGAHCASRALCGATLVVFFALLVPQVRRNVRRRRAEGSR